MRPTNRRAVERTNQSRPPEGREAAHESNNKIMQIINGFSINRADRVCDRIHKGEGEKRALSNGAEGQRSPRVCHLPGTGASYAATDREKKNRRSGSCRIYL